METISLGQYSLPVILTVVLGIVYNITTVPDKWKAFVAIGIGVILGLVGMIYNNPSPYTPVIVIDHVLYGFMAGAGAVGLYEGFRTFKNPRS